MKKFWGVVACFFLIPATDLVSQRATPQFTDLNDLANNSPPYPDGTTVVVGQGIDITPADPVLDDPADGLGGIFTYYSGSGISTNANNIIADANGGRWFRSDQNLGGGGGGGGGGASVVTSLADLAAFQDIANTQFVNVTQASTIDPVLGLYYRDLYASYGTTNATELIRSTEDTTYLWVLVDDVDETPTVSIDASTDTSISGVGDTNSILTRLDIGGAATWTNLLSAALDVRVFNAIGDGATDDTTAIQAAIDDATDRPVFIPPGTYLISTGLVVRTGTHLFGMPGQSILKRTFNKGNHLALQPTHETKPFGATIRNTLATNNQSVDFANGFDQNISISGLEFQTQDTNTLGAYISINQAVDVLIQDNIFRYVNVDMPYMDNSIPSTNQTDWAIDLMVSNCVVSDNIFLDAQNVFEDGIHVQGGWNIAVTGNHITSGDDAMIVASDADLPAKNIVYSGNSVNSQRGYMIKMNKPASSTNVYENIIFSGNGGSSGQTRNGGMYIRAVDQDEDINGVVVSDMAFQIGALADHTFTNSGTIVAGFPPGIYLEGGTNILLSTLTLPESQRYNIQADGVSDLRILDCTFGPPQLTWFTNTATNSFPTHSLYFEDCTNVLISGTEVRATTGGTNAAIYFKNGERLTVRDCDLYWSDANSYGIRIDGSGNYVDALNNYANGPTELLRFPVSAWDYCNIDYNNVLDAGGTLSFVGKWPTNYSHRFNLGNLTNSSTINTNRDRIMMPADMFFVVGGTSSADQVSGRTPAWNVPASGTTETLSGVLRDPLPLDWLEFEVEPVYAVKDVPGAENIEWQVAVEGFDGIDDEAEASGTTQTVTCDVPSGVNVWESERFTTDFDRLDNRFMRFRVIRLDGSGNDTWANEVYFGGLVLHRIE